MPDCPLSYIPLLSRISKIYYLWIDSYMKKLH
jgi:hypothetical protein